jgi:TnpA family transposase
MYQRNLLSEYHIRYGGWGGIGYYHVSDKYIALFSHFIPCGVYEAVYILDGLLKNTSEIQPDTLHADTHGLSAVVFGLAYLLGIKLMPRIKNWKHLKFFLPKKKMKLKNIGLLFTDTIDWRLIEIYMPDMLRVALSISKGKLAPSTILRRLGTQSRKNKLYFAFRELGRVVRTIYLLEYLSDEELRKTVRAATISSEEWNSFIDWIAFGGNGIITENVRDEQRKIIKYNHLVANLTVLHNVQTMMKILNDLKNEGYTITEQMASYFAPYRNSHINRFGKIDLKFDQIPEPLTPSIDF